MKTKKISSNKLIIFVLASLILISSIWAGSTFAYFSASKGASGTITMGTLKIDKLSKTDNTDIDWDISNVVPNQEFGGSYKAVVNSDINYYTRILFKASVSAQTGKTHDTTCADYKADPTDILNIQVGQTGTNSYTQSSTKTEDGYTVYYKLSPTTPTASTTDETFDIGLRVYNWVGNGGCDYYMGATININMQVEVIQADYLESQNKGTTFTDVNTMHTLWEKCIGISGGGTKLAKDISEYSNLTFKLDNSSKTASVGVNSNVRSTLTSVTIPAKVSSSGVNYNVTTVQASAFSSCPELQTVNIEDGVKTIEDNAFLYCPKLTTISIPSSVEIVGESFLNSSNISYNMYNNSKYLGSTSNPYAILIGGGYYEIHPDCTVIAGNAVAGKTITSITIPDKVKSIGDSAFSACTSLTSITIPKSVTSIGKDAFRACKSLKTLTFQDSAANIGETAFMYCRALTSVNLGNGVTSIANSAFYDCNKLTSITIPSSVKSIGSGVFNSCTSLTSITVNSNNANYSSQDGILFNKDKTTLLRCPQAKSGAYTIPTSVKIINNSAFYFCSKITSVTVPTGATKIGDSAFNSCSSLSSVNIPSTVTTIGNYAFSYTKITSITLSKALTSLGYYAFATNGDGSTSTINIQYAGTLADLQKIQQEWSNTTSSICYTIKCTDGNYTHYQATQPCLWVETEIWCWDDKKKRRYKKKLKDLTYDDDILVWDFDRGCFTTAKALFITRPQMAKAYTITTFSDGTVLKTIGADRSKRHRLFNVDTGRFEYIGTNMKIGTRTFNSKGEIVTITDMQFVDEKIEYMNVITEYHFNVFANGILTSNRLSNMYEIKDMKYVKDNRPMVDATSYPEIEEKYFNGLRLAEQNIKMQNSIVDMQMGDVVEFVNTWKSMSKPRD